MPTGAQHTLQNVPYFFGYRFVKEHAKYWSRLRKDPLERRTHIRLYPSEARSYQVEVLSEVAVPVCLVDPALVRGVRSGEWARRSSTRLT